MTNDLRVVVDMSDEQVWAEWMAEAWAQVDDEKNVEGVETDDVEGAE